MDSVSGNGLQTLGSSGDPPPLHSNLPTFQSSNGAESLTTTGDTNVAQNCDVSAPPDKCPGLSQTKTVLSSQDSMVYASLVSYDDSMNPEDINWISQEIEAKIAPYKPDSMVLSNNAVDENAAESSFLSIFGPNPSLTFVWLN